MKVDNENSKESNGEKKERTLNRRREGKNKCNKSIFQLEKILFKEYIIYIQILHNLLFQ